MRTIIIEKKGLPKFLAQEVVGGTAIFIDSIETDDKNLKNNELSRKLKREIEKIISESCNCNAISDTYIISEINDGKFIRYYSSLKLKSNKIGSNTCYYYDKIDEDLSKIIHKPDNPAEKMEKIRKFLYWNYQDLDDCMDFLQKRYLTKVRRLK